MSLSQEMSFHGAAQNLCKEQNKAKLYSCPHIMFSDGTLGKGEQNQWNPNAANEFAHKHVMNSYSCSYHIFTDTTSHLVHQTVG